MAYPDTEDILAGSTVTELTELEEAQADALRLESISAIEAYCRQSFVQEGTSGSPVTKKVSGGGSRTLELPARLSELTAIETIDADLLTSGVELSDSRRVLFVPDRGLGGSWYERAWSEDEAGVTSRFFPSGESNISVSGVWGFSDDEYDDLLGAITVALRLDMEDRALAGATKLAPSVNAARSLGLSSIHQGGLDVQLRTAVPGVSERVQRILAGRTPAGEAYVVELVGGTLI